MLILRLARELTQMLNHNTALAPLSLDRPAPIAPATIRDLQQRLRGRLLRPGDDEYDDARKIWNGMIDRHPALIARCAAPEDVVAAVNFARDYELPLAVRGGGHNVAGLAVCDGGLVADLSGMKGIQVDPAGQTGRAEPGLVWGEFDRATQTWGLALPGGIQSTTGIAGFTLGGGFGYLSRQHGLSSDNLLSARVVTADGRQVTASPIENPDLFWGLRGGGGNFGVVTSFEFRLHPLGPVLGGMLLYPLARAPEILRYYRDFVAQIPDELFTILNFMTAPAAPHLPERIHGAAMLAILVCWSGPLDAGEHVLRPLRDFGPPEVDLVGPRPYTVIQTMLDAANPPGKQNYWKAAYLSGLSDTAIETMVDHVARKPSALSKVLVSYLRGAISRLPSGESAYIHRQSPFLLNINAMWLDPKDTDEQIGWARDFWSAMQPFSTGGVYVNFLSNEGEDRVRAAYDADTYDRLVALKNKYDPANLFRLNQNIKPSV